MVERAPEVEREDSTFCQKILTLTDTLEVVRGCAALATNGKATKPHDDECRERIRTVIERTTTGKARMNAYKDRIAETERVKEKERARVERGAGDVLVEPRNRDDEQVAADMQAHLVVTLEKTSTKRTG